MNKRDTKKHKRTSKHRRSALERPLQISLRLTSQDVYRHGFRVIQVFEAHDALGEERLGVAHVTVEATHHQNAQVCRAELCWRRGRGLEEGGTGITSVVVHYVNGGIRTNFDVSARS